MSENVALLIVAGLIVAVVVALLLNRNFRARWGDKEVETGSSKKAGATMEMTASGKGSKIEDSAQLDSSGAAHMKMAADEGGQISGAKQTEKKNG